MNPIQELTKSVIKACYDVHNELGTGFFERVYENALSIVLKEIGLKCEQQARINVQFRGQIVGEYWADLLIENRLILELKTCTSLANEHYAQLINYLRATDIENGLLINFAKPGLEIRRAYI